MKINALIKLYQSLSIALLLFFNVAIAQNIIVITDLNNNAELELNKNQPFYFQLKNNPKTIYASQVSVVNNQLKFDTLLFSPNNISWISHENFRDNKFKKWTRTKMYNWHLTKKPLYDFENNHLIEIAQDTLTLLLDSEQFATPNNKQLLKLFFPQTLYSLKQQALSPFKMEGYRWGKTFLNAIIFAGVVFYDKKIDDGLRVTYNNNSFPIKSSKFLSLLGAEAGLGFTTLWLGKGLLLNQKKCTETSLLALQAALTATIWNRAVKYATLRERPYSAYANNNDQYNLQGLKSKGNLYGNSDFHSLGSGHTATAFALATAFAEQYQDIPLVKVICYTLAASVGISRMLMHKHWSSDILLGAAIGYGCGKQVTSFKQKFYKNKSKKYKIDTAISPFAINNKVFPTLCLTASIR